jgi:hypothetical protein
VECRKESLGFIKFKHNKPLYTTYLQAFAQLFSPVARAIRGSKTVGKPVLPARARPPGLVLYFTAQESATTMVARVDASAEKHGRGAEVEKLQSSTRMFCDLYR